MAISGRHCARKIRPAARNLLHLGHESIAVFAIEPKMGTLTLVADVPTGGKEPRHFALGPTGQYLLAENQLSGNIVEFRIDPATGKIDRDGEVRRCPHPSVWHSSSSAEEAIEKPGQSHLVDLKYFEPAEPNARTT